jgi:hypothetical protein
VASEIIGYLDARLSELRRILERLDMTGVAAAQPSTKRGTEEIQKVIAAGLELKSWLSVPSMKTAEVICVQRSLGWADRARATYYRAGCPASVAILTDARQAQLLSNGEYLRLVNEHLKMLRKLLGESVEKV